MQLFPAVITFNIVLISEKSNLDSGNVSMSYSNIKIDDQKNHSAQEILARVMLNIKLSFKTLSHSHGRADRHPNQ